MQSKYLVSMTSKFTAFFLLNAILARSHKNCTYFAFFSNYEKTIFINSIKMMNVFVEATRKKTHSVAKLNERSEEDLQFAH